MSHPEGAPGGAAGADQEDSVSVMLHIHCGDQGQAVLALETLSRAAAGLAFEGMYASLSISRLPDDPDEGT